MDASRGATDVSNADMGGHGRDQRTEDVEVRPQTPPVSAPPMSDFDDNLPIRRTFVDLHIGQLVGIFQIDRKQLSNTAQARSLSMDGMVGLVAVADGGRLSETAFNVWTLCSQMFDDHECPQSNRLDFNLSDYATRLWGKGGRSASRRKRIVNALSELMRTRVVIVGIDPYTLEPAEGAVWELSLLEAAGVRSHVQKTMDQARLGDASAFSRLAALSSKAADDETKATWSLVLPKWLADSVRRGHGVILDFDVQRALRGSAKHIWVQLESHGGWRSHQIARPTDEAHLAELVTELTRGVGQQVLPGDDDTVEVQSLVIALDDDAYQAFGLCHANRKRDLHAACESILRHDRTYLRAEVVTSPYNKRRFELHLVRARGAFRHERTRLSMQSRARRALEDAAIAA